jgi:hypothetical protein
MFFNLKIVTGSSYSESGGLGSIMTTNTSSEKTIKQLSPYVRNSISIFNEGPKIPFFPKSGLGFDESRSDLSPLEFQQHSNNASYNSSIFNQQRTEDRSSSYSPVKILSSNFFLNGTPMLDTLEDLHSKDLTGPTATFENASYFLDADRKGTKVISNNGLSQITENEDDENLDYQ